MKAKRGSGDIALLIFNLGTIWGGSLTPRTGGFIPGNISVPVRPVNYNNPNQWLPSDVLSNGTANFEVISDRAIEVLSCWKKNHFSVQHLYYIMPISWYKSTRNPFPICKKVFYFPSPSANTPMSNIFIFKWRAAMGLKALKITSGRLGG
jgi:hypothetical protein